MTPYQHLVDSASTLEPTELVDLIEELKALQPDVTFECVVEGPFDKDDDVAACNETAGRLLDKSCAHDIIEDNLWLGSDGRYYSWMVEASLTPVNPDYAQQMLEGLNDDA